VSDFTGIAIGVALLLGNAFFVGAEFAIISARRSQIEPLAEQGNRRAKITLKGMERVSLMLAGAQLGITVCSLGLGAVAEPAVAHLIEPWFEQLGLPPTAIHAVSFAIALSLVVYLHIVLGEMVPKNIALATPERSALWLGPLLWGFVWVLRPVIGGLNTVANLGLRMLRVPQKDEVTAAFTEEEVALLIAESGREGMIGGTETALASGALGLVARPAAELVIPEDLLRTVSIDDTVADVLSATMDTGFSRFPVVDNTATPVGYVHVRDLLDAVTGAVDDQTPLQEVTLRPLPMVAASASAATVAEILRVRGAHLARVMTPDGNDVGILALEDALEELIGEVRDTAHRRTRV
jgi:CBS domain containing-hemolysin-like protein